jgi:hypothetical protein
MAGKRTRSNSDNVTSKNRKRAKMDDTPAIKEEETPVAPQPVVKNKIKTTAPMKEPDQPKVISTSATRTGATTQKDGYEDNINCSDEESEIMNGADTTNDALPKSEAAHDDDIEDGADTTLVGSEDDVDKIKTETTDGEEDAVNIKLTDETAKTVSQSSDNDASRENVIGEDDTATKIKAGEETPERQKTAQEEAVEKQERDSEYFAMGRDFIFKGIETGLNFPDIVTWLGMGTVGATETRQMTVNGVTIEVSVKLLKTDFDASAAKDSNEADEIGFDEEDFDTVLPSTEETAKLTVDTTAKSKARDAPATSRTATSATPSSTVTQVRKPTACMFGEQCNKRDICTFDHSQSVTKKPCGFVNTNMGCNKGMRCRYSHDHEGQMCQHGTVRGACPGTFKCPFQHMDDQPPRDVDENPAFGWSTPPVTLELSAADIAERAAANRASREATAARAPPPDAPTGPKNSKRARGADDGGARVNLQRPRHNYQTPAYFEQQQMQQRWPVMPGFGPPPTQYITPPGGYYSQQGPYVPPRAQFNPQQGFYNSGYAGNQQQGHGRGRGNGRTRGGGGDRGGRGNARQNDRQQNSGGGGGGGNNGAGSGRDMKVKGAAQGADAGASDGGIKVKGAARKA